MHGPPVGKLCILGVMRWRRAIGHVLKAGNAGIVDENVEFGEQALRPAPVRFRGHIQMTICTADGPGCGFTAFVIDIGHNDARAFTGKGLGNGRTNTARRPRHESALSRKSGHDKSLGLHGEGVWPLVIPAHDELLSSRPAKARAAHGQLQSVMRQHPGLVESQASGHGSANVRFTGCGCPCPSLLNLRERGTRQQGERQGRACRGLPVGFVCGVGVVVVFLGEGGWVVPDVQGFLRLKRVATGEGSEHSAQHYLRAVTSWIPAV